jgi:hypothetical protein
VPDDHQHDDLAAQEDRGRLREIEVARSKEARNVELRRQLVQQLRTGERLDADAAYEVRERGWTH